MGTRTFTYTYLGTEGNSAILISAALPNWTAVTTMVSTLSAGSATNLQFTTQFRNSSTSCHTRSHSWTAGQTTQTENFTPGTGSPAWNCMDWDTFRLVNAATTQTEPAGSVMTIAITAADLPGLTYSQTVSANQGTSASLTYQVISGGTQIALTVTAAVAQAVTRTYLVCVPRPYSHLETLSYAQLETQTYAQLEILCSAGALPVAVGTTQSQAVSLARAVSLRRTVGQGQALGLVVRRTLSRILSLVQPQSVSLQATRIFQRTLTAIQTQAVRLVKALGFVRGVTLAESPTLASAIARSLAASQSTSVRLLQQARLSRSLSQPHVATFGGLPVQLHVVSVVQTRSLALVRAVFLRRTIAQAQAFVLKNDELLIRTAQSATLARLVWAAALRRTIKQPTQVALEWQAINPRYQLLVTAQVSQHVALAQATTGKPARVFAVASCRTIVFPTCQRSGHFQAPRRGVTFTAEVR